MPDQKSDLYIANQSFSMMVDGVAIGVAKGDLAEAGAPELKGHMHFFDPAEISDVVKFKKPAKAKAEPKAAPKRRRHKAPAKKAEPPKQPERPHFGLRTSDIESATAAPGEKRD